MNWLISFDLKIGVTRAILRLSGIMPLRKVKLKMCARGSEISLAIFLIICELTPSYPGLFLEFNFFISVSISYFVIGSRKKLSLCTI